MNFELGGVLVEAPFPLQTTLLCGGLLALYWGAARRHARQTGQPRGVSRRQAAFFTTGIALLWIADGWPVLALSELLLSVHMVQHVLQSFVIPPLILLGIPAWMGEWLLRGPRVGRVVRRLARPVTAGLVFNAVVIATHTPQAMNLQLSSSLFHAADHLLLIGTGLLMYANVYSPTPRLLPPLEPLRAMFYLFLMTILPTIPTAFLIFGEQPLYPAYVPLDRPWGLSVIEDMQIGGLIMKLGGGFYLWTIITIKYFRWAAAQEREARGPSRRGDGRVDRAGT